LNGSSSWTNLAGIVEVSQDTLSGEAFSCKEGSIDRSEKSTVFEFVGTRMGETVENDLDCCIENTAQVWYPCYNVEADVCSGSERSLEENCIFDSPDMDSFIPSNPSLTTIDSQMMEKSSYIRQQSTIQQQNSLKQHESHLSSTSHMRPAASGPLGVFSSMRQDQAYAPENISDHYGPSADDCEEGDSLMTRERLNESGQLSVSLDRAVGAAQNSVVGRPRSAWSGSSRATASDVSSVRHGRATLHNSSAGGTPSATAAAAARSPKTCAYDGCPCPLQSNKWRTVTTGTAAGQQVPFVAVTRSAKFMLKFVALLQSITVMVAGLGSSRWSNAMRLLLLNVPKAWYPRPLGPYCRGWMGSLVQQRGACLDGGHG
jgi:hypothetical protein